MTPLQIQNARERAIVRTADALLAPLGWRGAERRPIRRILLLRLERIGDLLMALDAIDDVRRAWPDSTIHLAVGSWNWPIATLIRAVDHVHVADVPWLSRGERPTSWRAVVGEARGWRQLRYDMVVNFEPDIRSNLVAWLSGAPVRVGYASGGGGPLLTTTGTYDPAMHVGENARRLVATAAGSPVPEAGAAVHPRLDPLPEHKASAAAALAGARRPLVGMHVSGGRESKQWHLDRFAAVARTLSAETGATIVMTGARTDRPTIDRVVDQLENVPIRIVAGALDLPATAALAAMLDLFITSDTGPMHIAAAMGTPVVALFGPSDPARYGPRAASERILRVQLPCSPCGQVRLPPERCRGHVPDCMDGITVEAVVGAALELLRSGARQAVPI